MKEFRTTTGGKISRVSRWIEVKHNYNPNKRNSLYYYAQDENGYMSGQRNFNPENGLCLDYFIHDGKTYALNQFILMGGMMGGTPEAFIDTDGKLTVIGAYDSLNYYNPLMIELDEYGERVRCYYAA